MLNFWHMILWVIFLVMFFPQQIMGVDEANDIIHLGAVIDLNSQSGKEEEVAIKMAIEDFCAQPSHMPHPCPILYVANSLGDPAQAAHLARSLIEEHKVKAIIGFETWQETVFVADLGNNSRVPILSLANEIPSWSTTHWPFLVNAARSQLSQMKAVAAIVNSWRWRKVNIIYEDNISPSANDITFLISSINEMGSQVSNLLPLPPFPETYNLSKKLGNLKETSPSRVFILHSSLSLAIKIVTEAKKLGMMEEGFVWITTSSVSNHIDSLSASIISQMEGVLGVRSYFSQSGKRFENFQLRFQKKFSQIYQKRQDLEPGFLSLQAFDAAWAMILALEGEKDEFLNRILQTHFEGFAGTFKFNETMMSPAKSFEIINVVGKSSRKLGYWSEGLGFWKNYNGRYNDYNKSMRFLGNVIWVGDPLSIPKGWGLATALKPLKIGVPANATFSVFVKVTYRYPSDKKNPIVRGFSIDVFKAMVEHLPYPFAYEFIPFNGSSYDSLVEQVSLQNFDAVVADTAIVSHRYQHVEFSQPYTEWGVQILVYNQKKKLDKTWLFTKPFEPLTWMVIVLINIYNGIAISIIEPPRPAADLVNAEQLPIWPIWTWPWVWRRVKTIVLKAFTILFSMQGEQKKDLSRFVLVAWLFVALIITSSYTASLSSMLTADRLAPTRIDVETLRMSGAVIGCNGYSFVYNYLIDVLEFNPENIRKIYREDEYRDALMNGEIKAAFLEVPYAKLFLARYCDVLITSGPVFRIGGFGFAFQKNSPYLSDISQAVVRISETGRLRELENSLISSYNCSSLLTSSTNTNYGRLDYKSFLGVIGISGGASTIALLIFFCQKLINIYRNHNDNGNGNQDPDVNGNGDPNQNHNGNGNGNQDPDVDGNRDLNQNHNDNGNGNQDPDVNGDPNNNGNREGNGN